MGALVAFLAFARSSAKRHRRHRALARIARELNLNWTSQDRLNLPVRYDSLTLLNRGHNRRATEVISGPTALGAISCFRYECELGFGAARQVRRWGLAVIESDLDLPTGSALPPGGADRSDWWHDAVPETAALQNHGDVRVFSQTDSFADIADGELLDWLTRLDRPCGLETCGRLISVSLPDPAEPTCFQWLISTAQTAAEKVHSSATGRPGEQETKAT